MEYLLFPIHFQIIPRDAFFLVSLPPWIGEQGFLPASRYMWEPRRSPLADRFLFWTGGSTRSANRSIVTALLIDELAKTFSPAASLNA